MTNFEKYKDEIIKIFYEKGAPIAREKNTGRIVCCDDISCVQCQFTLGNCVVNMFEWMLKEYQEPVPKLTSAERGFCETVKRGYIARHRNGIVIYYTNLAYKVPYDGYWWSEGDLIKLKTESFSFIRWEDTKPWRIEDLLKLEVEE